MSLFNKEQKEFLLKVLSECITRVGMPLTIKINENQELTKEDCDVLLNILRIDLRPFQDILIKYLQDKEIEKIKKIR